MIESSPAPAASNSPAKRLFLLGDHVFDPERRLLVRDREAIKLEPRVSQVLEYLAGAAPRRVSKAELIREVWGLNVVDQALHRAISLARSALGDSEAARVLETLGADGYRMNRVTLLSASTPLAAPIYSARAIRDLAIAFVAGAVLALGAARLLAPSPEPTPGPTPSWAPEAPSGEGSNDIAPPAPAN